MTIKLRYSNDTQRGELVMNADAGIATDGGIETAIQNLLFSDRQAEPGDAIPDGSNDRRGWWADAFDPDGRKHGSRLWLVRGEKALPGIRRRVKTYVLEALQPLIDAGVALQIKTEPFTVRPGVIGIPIEVLRPDDPAPRWESFWQELDLEAA